MELPLMELTLAIVVFVGSIAVISINVYRYIIGEYD